MKLAATKQVSSSKSKRQREREGGTDGGAGGSHTDSWAGQRRRMVEEQIVARGVSDKAVLSAMQHVPRHEFVPPADRSAAYEDRPLPLGPDQTISQPYIVAYMVEQLQISPGDRVLEVGTGSGYQAAVLAELMNERGAELYTIDIDPGLIVEATETLQRLGYGNIHLRAGDGAAGWPEAAPFDKIIVAAASDDVPRALINQLSSEGKMIIPVGDVSQSLVLFSKHNGELSSRELGGVRFVPLKTLTT